jgi:hypothetical protein
MPPVRVVPALDEVEDRHPGLGLGGEMGGPVRRHELESLDGIEPVSLANQAAVGSTDERNSS